MEINKWIRSFYSPSTDLSPIVLVFPHAGSGASAYRSFSKVLSQKFAVYIFQYPARQDRQLEPPAASIVELAQGAVTASIEAKLFSEDKPVIVFGHSLGGIIAYEFVQYLAKKSIFPTALCVSSAVAPSIVETMPNHPTESEEILAHIANLSGTPLELVQNDQIMQLALPVLKNDYRIFDNYIHNHPNKIDTDVYVLRGKDDPYVKNNHIYDWKNHTSKNIKYTVYSGSHFFIDENLDQIFELFEQIGNAK